MANKSRGRQQIKESRCEIKEIVTKDLEICKEDCNVAENHEYATIKYFFIYDKEHKIYRMKKGPNGRSLLTLSQFLETDAITRLLDPESGIIDSLVYYDKPGPARKEITEEEALVNSSTEDPANKPTPSRPSSRLTWTTPKWSLMPVFLVNIGRPIGLDLKILL